MSENTDFESEAPQTSRDDSADALAAALIKRVGKRVRRARELKAIPRRVLSDMSGVSPRYLAQLESGDGNISIGLLQKVAAALDLRIEWFVTTEDPWSSDMVRVMDLFHRADFKVRQDVIDLLSPDTETDARADRVCLIGLRGAGKSTLGALLGQRLHVPFVELNRQIEEQSGMPVNELLAFYGHDGYRKLEAQALERVVATHQTLVLAVSGGIVADPATYNHLLAHFHTIWLRATPEDHMARVLAQGDTRPVRGNPQAMDQLKSILASREALYGHALVHIDTSGKGVDETLGELVAVIQQRRLLQ